MAMQDYFYPCHKLEKETISDGLGGYETALRVGIEFQGLAVQKGSNEQLIGALRGNEHVQYTFSCPSNVPLEKDDIIMFKEPNSAITKYIRLTGSEEVNPERSLQTDWKKYNAESYMPTTIIRGV